MAMFAPSATATHGVYQWLVEREEQEYSDWQVTHGQAPGAAYLRRAGLYALRAGAPVTVSISALPGWARPSSVSQPPPTYTAAHRREYRRTSRQAVTVYADDRVVPGAEGEWLTADYRLL